MVKTRLNQFHPVIYFEITFPNITGIMYANNDVKAIRKSAMHIFTLTLGPTNLLNIYKLKFFFIRY